MIKYLCLFIGIALILSCKKETSDRIVLVDIENLDIIGISKELKAISQCHPKLIGLNFMLTTDSLVKDIALAKEIADAKNIVQGVILHNNNPIDISEWDSLEQYHPKFRKADFGFVNFTITDDSVVVPEMSMKQYHNGDPVPAFCYVMARRHGAET